MDAPMCCFLTMHGSDSCSLVRNGHLPLNFLTSQTLYPYKNKSFWWQQSKSLISRPAHNHFLEPCFGFGAHFSMDCHLPLDGHLFMHCTRPWLPIYNFSDLTMQLNVMVLHDLYRVHCNAAPY